MRARRCQQGRRYRSMPDDDSPASVIVTWDVFDSEYEAYMRRVHAELSEQSRMFTEDLDSESNEVNKSEGNEGICVLSGNEDMSIFGGDVIGRCRNKKHYYKIYQGHQNREIPETEISSSLGSSDESGATSSSLIIGSSGVLSLKDHAVQCTIDSPLIEHELDRHQSDESGATSSSLIIGSSGVLSLKDHAASSSKKRMLESQKKYRGTLLAKVGERRRQQREYKLFLLAEALFADKAAFQELYHREKVVNYAAFEQLAQAPVESRSRRLRFSIPWPDDSEILAAIKEGTIQQSKETGDRARQKRRSIVATIGELLIRHSDIFRQWLEKRDVYIDFKLLYKLAHLPVTPEKLSVVPWPNNIPPIPAGYVLGCVCPVCFPLTQSSISAEYAQMLSGSSDDNVLELRKKLRIDEVSSHA